MHELNCNNLILYLAAVESPTAALIAQAIGST